jgi:hypothetical protein
MPSDTVITVNNYTIQSAQFTKHRPLVIHVFWWHNNEKRCIHSTSVHTICFCATSPKKTNILITKKKHILVHTQLPILELSINYCTCNIVTWASAKFSWSSFRDVAGKKTMLSIVWMSSSCTTHLISKLANNLSDPTYKSKTKHFSWEQFKCYLHLWFSSAITWYTPHLT